MKTEKKCAKCGKIQKLILFKKCTSLPDNKHDWCNKCISRGYREHKDYSVDYTEYVKYVKSMKETKIAAKHQRLADIKATGDSSILKAMSKDERESFKKTQAYKEYLKKQAIFSKQKANLKEKERRVQKNMIKNQANHKLAEQILKDNEGECKIMDENPEYIIFKDSRIYSIKDKKFIGTADHRCGYLFSCRKFTINGKKQMMLLHRLVGLNWVDNPNGYNEINHIDFDKKNCAADNLEWVNKKQNMDHYWDTKPIRKSTGNFQSKGVIQYSKDGKEIARFDSMKEAAEKTGTNRQCLTEAVKGRLQTSNGYIWKYDPDNISKISLVGEKNTQAKLKDAQINGIRALRESGMKPKTIAEMFGVSTTVIYSITNGKTWKEVV